MGLGDGCEEDRWGWETYLCHFLDEFLRHILWEELGSELELIWVLFADILTEHLRNRQTCLMTLINHTQIM